MLGMKVTHLLELPEGRKTVPLGVDEKVEEEKEKEEESGGEASRVASEKREERARDDHLRFSSISDKNKVNGEWGCARGVAAAARGGRWLAGVGTRGLGEMLLRAGDDAGPYQSEGRKAKSTAIDATGHAEYNEEDAPLRFPFVARSRDIVSLQC